MTNLGLTIIFLYSIFYKHFSFSLKSSFEMMEVCWRQRTKSGRGGQASHRNSSRSTGLERVSNLDPPAWLDSREHPLIQGIASDICSRLSIYGHCSLPKGKPASLSFYPERSQLKRRSHPSVSSNRFYSLRADGEYLESNAR